MNSKNCKDYSRIVLDLLNGKIKYEDLKFENNEDIIIFQKKLLEVSNSKEEINDIINMSKGLLSKLNFIKENFQKIIKVIENSLSIFSRWNINYYILDLDESLIDGDIDIICKTISDIIGLTKEKNIQILNYDNIFKNMVDIFYYKNLDEFCKLHNIIEILKKERIEQRIVEDFYYKENTKGISLIKNK